MHYYCEKCLLVSEQDSCQSCGKRNLRNPTDKDFCFITEVDSMFGEMLKGILEDMNIPYSDIPSGNGVRSYFALKLENLKIFVPYEFYSKVKELLYQMYSDIAQENSRELKVNIDKLFATSRSEKKMKKILKIAEDDSLIDYCTNLIMNADSVVNEGSISGCINGGDYLFVYKGEELIIVNSATYEIIAAKRLTK